MTPENEAPPVETVELRKSFGGHAVLNGISFQVGKGEILSVLGRSGTGKSVLLKLMIRLLAPDSGMVRILGQEIAKLEEKQLSEVRKKVGFLFQAAALYDSLTVAENVEFPLRRHARLSPAERNSRVRELLESVGMPQDLDKMPSEISGGMQKRVGLARALALDPGILLFDEPTAGLDPITATEIGNLILDLKKKRGMTAVVVTHDIRGAKLFSDRVILMRDGSLAFEGTFADMEKSRDQFVVQFRGDGSERS
jgi:phospholipid/cholesterol/gamma-HCH transport system ATP-binding protein